MDMNGFMDDLYGNGPGKGRACGGAVPPDEVLKAGGAGAKALRLVALSGMDDDRLMEIYREAESKAGGEAPSHDDVMHMARLLGMDLSPLMEGLPEECGADLLRVMCVWIASAGLGTDNDMGVMLLMMRRFVLPLAERKNALQRMVDLLSRPASPETSENAPSCDSSAKDMKEHHPEEDNA